MSTSDDYYTPKWLFDKLGVWFDVDVCAPIEGPLHTPCTYWHSIKDDGLSQSWHGLVWMNPPYSNSKPWVEKWLEHGSGIALLPTSRARWFSKLWESDASIVHPTPTDTMFNFIRDGQPANIYMPVILAAIGKGKEANLSAVGKIRN